jgi:putative flippase GtrA
MKSILWKFFKFGIVGFSGVLVDFGVTYLVKEKMKGSKYLANSLGFAFAVTSNFLLNRIWTFESKDSLVWLQYSKFILVALIGLVLSNGMVYLLTERKKLNFYLAKVIAIGVVMLWNFVANYQFTFRA